MRALAFLGQLIGLRLIPGAVIASGLSIRGRNHLCCTIGRLTQYEPFPQIALRTVRTMTASPANVVRADPLGIMPRYARRGVPGRDVAASDAGIMPLVLPGEEVDALGLALLLTLGFSLGDRTVFRDIRRLEPGEIMSHADSGQSGRARPVRPNESSPSDSQLLELFRNALERYPSRQMPIVPLSGGRDSRLILLGLRSMGLRPRVILTGGGLRASSDAIVAARLAARLDETIEGVQPLAFDMGREIWRHQAQNFESLEHGWFLGVALRARALGGPVTDGLGLGVLATGSLMKPEAIALWRAGATDELADWTIEHAAGIGDEFLSKLAMAGVPLASADEVRHELVRTLRSLDHLPNPLGAFSLFHWTRRGISASPYGLLNPRQTFAPLCDAQLAAATLAIELDEAVKSDWRERILNRLDDLSIPFSDAAGNHWPVRKARAGLYERLRGRLEWSKFSRELPTNLQALAGSLASNGGVRWTFQRSALGLIASMRAATVVNGDRNF